jgi:hypothetical protein
VRRETRAQSRALSKRRRTAPGGLHAWTLGRVRCWRGRGRAAVLCSRRAAGMGFVASRGHGGVGVLGAAAMLMVVLMPSTYRPWRHTHALPCLCTAHPHVHRAAVTPPGGCSSTLSPLDQSGERRTRDAALSRRGCTARRRPRACTAHHTSRAPAVPLRPLVGRHPAALPPSPRPDWLGGAGEERIARPLGVHGRCERCRTGKQRAVLRRAPRLLYMCLARCCTCCACLPSPALS